jgi:formate-dependent nitrite reductase membrane component NrfD
MWSEQWQGPQSVVSGHPHHANSSAAALLSYDVPHVAPWDWRVSLYTWSKSLSSGVYLVPALLVLAGLIDPQMPLWRIWTPAVAGAFLALTGLLLIADLKHPERFYLIFTRPQWRSWLVRGAFIIAAYAAVLLLHFLAGLSGAPEAATVLTVAGVPLSIATAVYTAYLFAQAKGRDLWQSPLLPPHLAVQALLGGAALLAVVAATVAPEVTPVALNIVAVHALLHLLFVFGETSLPHVTTHARLAAWEMTSGRVRGFFRAGAAGVALGLFAPWLGVPAALSALAGLAAYEHAYVQAGQAVPLA